MSHLTDRRNDALAFGIQPTDVHYDVRDINDLGVLDAHHRIFGEELYVLDETEDMWYYHESGPECGIHQYCPVCGDCVCTSHDCDLELMLGDYDYFDFDLLDYDCARIEDNPEMDGYYEPYIQEAKLPIIDSVDKPKRRRGPWSRTKKQRSRDGSGGKRSKKRRKGTYHRGQGTTMTQMCKFWERADRVNANRLMRNLRDAVVDPDDCSEMYMRTTAARVK